MIRFNINLASGDYSRKRMVLLALYSTMAVLILLIGLDFLRFERIRETESAFGARMARLLNEKRQLQQEIGRMGRGTSSDSMKTLRKEVEFINELLYQKSFSWTAFLSDLEKEVPSHISVSRIQPDFKNGLVVLGGKARSLAALTRFVENLQKGGPFEEVFLIDQEISEEEKGEISFSLRFKYKMRNDRT